MEVVVAFEELRPGGDNHGLEKGGGAGNFGDQQEVFGRCIMGPYSVEETSLEDLVIENSGLW